MDKRSKRTRLLGFAPDADTTIPGVIVDGDMFYANRRGVRAIPTMEVAPLGAQLTAPPLGMVWARPTVDGADIQLFAHADGSLRVLSNRSWVDVQGAATVGTPSDWTAFGDSTLCSSISTGLRVQDGSATGAFANVASSPKSKILFSAGLYLIAANGDMTDFGGENKEDAWATSNVADFSEWDPTAPLSSASYGRALTPSGPIIAGESLGEFAVLYKKDAILMGAHNGIDGFEFIPIEATEIGCIGKNAMVSAEGGHFFMSDSDFYFFNGGQPQSIGEDIREHVFDTYAEFELSEAQAVYDRQRKLVVWMIGDAGYAFSIESKRWGRCNFTAGKFVRNLHKTPNIFEFETGGNIIGAGYRPAVMFVSGAELRLNRKKFDRSHIITGDFGDDDMEIDVVNVRTRFNRPFETADLTHYSRDWFSHDPYAEIDTAPIEEDRFQLRRQAKWHRQRIDFTGDWELSMIDMAAPKGARS